MTEPADDPDSYPAVFDVYVAPFNAGSPAPLPGNAADQLDESVFSLVGKVDGKTLYSYGGLGKGVNPFPVEWTDGPQDPFAYGTAYTTVFQGVDPQGGHMRACVAQVTYTAGSGADATGDAQPDRSGTAAYWYYEPAA